MVRRSMLGASLVGTVLLIAYLGREYLGAAPVGNWLGFLEKYFIQTRRYIYPGMVYALPWIFATALPILEPSYRVRLETNLGSVVVGQCVGAGLGLSLYVLAAAWAVGLGLGMPMGFHRSILGMLLRYWLLYAQCGFLFYLVYAWCRNPVAAIAGVFLINMIFLAALLAWNFTLAPRDTTLMPIFDTYAALTYGLSMEAVWWGCGRKDWLI